jgi:hypothetical protein
MLLLPNTVAGSVAEGGTTIASEATALTMEKTIVGFFLL